jgi:hypothetical protein
MSGVRRRGECLISRSLRQGPRPTIASQDPSPGSSPRSPLCRTSPKIPRLAPPWRLPDSTACADPYPAHSQNHQRPTLHSEGGLHRSSSASLALPAQTNSTPHIDLGADKKKTKKSIEDIVMGAATGSRRTPYGIIVEKDRQTGGLSSYLTPWRSTGHQRSGI